MTFPSFVNILSIDTFIMVATIQEDVKEIKAQLKR
jgi:hypothetical protein|tara:strand:+ start:5586 stop:5690 length:105 start_codon:yes stop_codon:yes gene_type:complete